MELDKALEKMGEALAALNEEKAAGKGSRELAITVTELETAILWRRQDLRIKDPAGTA